MKPYHIDDVAATIKNEVAGKLVISLAAAKGIEGIESILTDSRVARVMTGLHVGDETACYAFGTNYTDEDVSAIKYIFGDDAVNVQEDLLAHRTAIACDTGIIAKEIETRVEVLHKMGMDIQDARTLYASVLEGIAKQLKNSVSGDQICDNVGGEGSYTLKICDQLEVQDFFEQIKKYIEMTVVACK